ncbi:PaaI family thioesterase [Yoonia sp. F2084L]|uniref:PaaI family thioesterase n=1 Tax=Yoonia sp. F2084L TaxID=2926419 RepID=UPI001FF425DD|nr:PaaI family thioesterase [Yoonia sp. F2084L]MCK0095459.1 PaaI family thioesterase [Yoonia sp. F2084L]
MEYGDPQSVARMRADFDRQGAMQTMGITVADVAPGRVVLEMPFNPDFTQHHGFIHAAAITAGMDSACGFAALTLMDAESEVLTVEFKCSFMAPARGQSFRFEGDVLKSGRTLTFTEGRAIAIDGTQETTVATITATMMAVRGLKT